MTSRGGWRPRWIRGTVLSELGIRAEGAAFLLLCLLGLVLAGAFDGGGWMPPALSLKGVVLLSVVTGVALARIRLPSVVSHSLSGVVGLGVVLWWGQVLRPESHIAGRVQGLLGDLISWWQAVNAGEFTEGAAVLAMLVAALTWVVGYLWSWSVFRWGNGWLVLLTGSIGLLVVLSQLPENRYPLFLVFLFLGLVLIAYIGWVGRVAVWRSTDRSLSVGGAAAVWAGVLLLGATSLLVAWQVPNIVGVGFNGVINQSLPHWREGGRELGERLFGGARLRGSVFSGSETLRLRGTSGLGDTVLFVVNAEEPYFWREKSFDTYTSQGWLNRLVAERDMPARGRSGEIGSQGSADVLHRVRVKVRSDILLTTGDPVRTSVPSIMVLASGTSYDVDLSRSPAADGLPADIAESLERLNGGSVGVLSERALREVLPGDVEVLSVGRSGGQVVSARLVRRQTEDDIVSLRARRYLSADQEYGVLSSVSVVAPSVLRTSSVEYPVWVSERYLQLPPQLPLRVRSLAREVADSATNQYDRAKAIKDYLHRIPYASTVSPPPGRRDVVDYFLFSSRVGYCEYYASAMTVMLRSLGVPARLVIGFTPGEWDIGRRLFVVRERNYHAWTEVYFPAYGWVMFDPTPPGGNNNAIAGVNVVDAPQSVPMEASGGLGSVVSEDDPDDGSAVGEGEIKGVRFPFPVPGGGWWGLLIVMAVIFTVLLVVRRVSFGVWWGVGSGEHVRGLYVQMCWIASRAGLAPRASLTPREYSEQLAVLIPNHAPAIMRLSKLYAAARYGPARPLASGEMREVSAEWRSLRNHLLRRIFWRRLNWRAI